MSTKRTIPLPDSCKELKEAIDIIVATDLLADNSDGYGSYIVYGVHGESIISFQSFPCNIVVPYNISEYNPPYVVVRENYLSNILNRDEFESEIKKLKIIVIKHDYDKKFGFIQMSGTKPLIDKRWHLILTDQSKFYDLYLLCYKYDLFKNHY